MGGPFDKPPMTQVEFVAELKARGFHFCENTQRWVGPFGLSVTGVPGQANFHTESGMFNPQGIGNAGLTGGGIGPGVSGLRRTLLADIDEQLRAKRGLPRPLYRQPPPPGQ